MSARHSPPTGLGLVVFAILKASTWGWLAPKQPPTIDGHELTPFGFSPVPFVVLIGLCVLGLFAMWEEHREKQGKDALLIARC
jgi:hypothetical protein